MVNEQRLSVMGKVQELRHTMPFKLLVLTIVFVLFAEILVFIPSVANFRKDWMVDRIERAHLAELVFESAPKEALNEKFLVEVFENAEVEGVTIMIDGTVEMLKAPRFPDGISGNFYFVDLKRDNFWKLTWDALGAMFNRHDNDYIMISGAPKKMPDRIVEIIVERGPLRTEMWSFARSIVGLSLFISALVASLIYFSLSRMVVKPLTQLTNNIVAFQRDPENTANLVAPSEKPDEIGQAQRALASMQLDVRASLKQKARLATLGEGVSKINHDLRNVLSSAMLMSDRLAKSDDPRMQKLSPRLVQALNRAVSLCRATLDYGRAEEVNKAQVNLFGLVDEVEESLAAFTSKDADPRILLVNDVDPNMELQIDRMQMFRALHNLCKNSAEALTQSGTDASQIAIAAEVNNFDQVVISITDNGPGVPEEAQNNLFTPFKGSVRQGGTGLGLAITDETVRAHGGEVKLARSNESGTVFEITLPL